MKDDADRGDGTVGVRELKNRLSAVLRRVRAGATVTVTERRRPVARLVPCAAGSDEELLRGLVAAGLLAWSGGKPRGSRRPARIRGGAVADAVLEERR
jgi:prevent-host-death family protein